MQSCLLCRCWLVVLAEGTFKGLVVFGSGETVAANASPKSGYILGIYLVLRDDGSFLFVAQ